MSKILLLEDDPALRENLRTGLESAGHQVTPAGDGRAGLKCLRTDDFDLVITDIFMPEADGIETLSRLRRACRHIPVIAMSGGGQQFGMDFLKLAGSMGAAVTLQKPFRISTMLEHVDILVS